MVSYKKKPLLPTSYERLSELLCIAIWFALLTSYGECFLLLMKKYVFHREVGSWHIIWMTPLAEVCLFGIFGLILFAVRRCWPRLLSVRLVLFLLAFPSFLGLLGMYPKLYSYAILLLAAGLAVQTARLSAARPQAFGTLVHRTTGWLVALLGSLVMGMLLWHMWYTWSEQRAFAMVPPAPPGAPNVLLITLDTVRAQSLSLYGYAQPTTPQLEQWATTGVRFERAFSTAPWTLPAHASMFTGRLPHETRANWLVPLDATYPTLAEVLRQRGYVTAGFVANMTYCGEHSGLSRGFSHYEAAVVSPTEFVLSSALVRMVANARWFRWLIGSHQIFGRKDAAEVNSAFLRWLPRQGQRPFFVFLNYFDAHEPYLPPPPFAAPSDSKGWWEDVSHTKDRSDYLDLWKMSPQQTQALREAYEGAIAYLDHALGRLFDELHNRGVLDNTLVIVTSDHGEQFGEHRLYTHGNSLYSQALHVPLVLFLPRRVPAGLSIPEPVSLRDLPATVLDLIGFESTQPFPGHSLARYWESGNGTANPGVEPLLSEVSADSLLPLQEWYALSKGDMQSLVFGGYHYIKNGDGSEELYDLEHDPFEQYDITHSERGIGLRAQARHALDSLLARHSASHN